MHLRLVMSKMGSKHGEGFFGWVLQSGGTMFLVGSATASLTSCTVSHSSAEAVSKHALEACDEQDGAWAW